MNLGFIGLGIMGAPMALHLIEAGHQLYVQHAQQGARQHRCHERRRAAPTRRKWRARPTSCS